MEEDGLGMIARRLTIFLIIKGAILFTICNIASADIYRYQDESGVWHFTNIKNDTRYRLYIKTYSKKPSEYIKEYERHILQASEKFRVDPALIKAVIKAESDFDRRSVSSKGAMGLMQLMPETANDMKVTDPFNPEANILGGTKYLSLMLERFRNNRKLALAAYNAGPEMVENYKGIPPFSETRTFIDRVLRYYKKYKSDEN